MLLQPRKTHYQILARIALRSRELIQSYNRRPGSRVYAARSYGVSNVGAGGWRFV